LTSDLPWTEVQSAVLAYALLVTGTDALLNAPKSVRLFVS